MLEDAEWRSYFWTLLPTDTKEDVPKISIATALLTTISDLLFCPNFTINSINKIKINSLSALDSCEYIWQTGVGFATKTPINVIYDANRTELLKLLLVCFSELIYVNVKGLFILIN